jgi:hypothetical protein
MRHVNRLAKERILVFLLTFHFLEFLFYLDLREGLDDIAHLDVVEVHQ